MMLLTQAGFRGRGMVRTFDRIVIAVPDLQAAVEQYQLLLGAAPFTYDNVRGESVAWWGLTNTVMELAQSAVDTPRIQGIVFHSLEAAQSESPVANSMGIDIRICDGRPTADFRRLRPEAGSPCRTRMHCCLHKRVK